MKFASTPKVARIVLYLLVSFLSGGQRANAITTGVDGRQEIERFSLSADERAAMYQIIGLVDCPGGKGTAFVIDGGQNLLTNAHVIDGGTTCTFSRKQFSRSIPIYVTNATTESYGSRRADAHDWAIVPLNAQIRTPVFKLGVSPQDGMQIRDLTEADQILYGIPDDVSGVIVWFAGSRTDFKEREVLLGEALDRFSKLRAEGVHSLTVNVRKIDGQMLQRTLSIE